MKKHTLIGARILSGSDVPVIKMAETIALTHHEKWDGSGYPEGLKGTSIPLAGRITAVADAFDALTSPRCYRGAYSAKQALDIIHSESGSHFDLHIVSTFLAIKDEILAIKEELKDEEKDIAESFTDDITQRDMVREVPLLIKEMEKMDRIATGIEGLDPLIGGGFSVVTPWMTGDLMRKSMKNIQKRSEKERITGSEIRVECSRCHTTMIAKLADIRSNRLLKCPVCRTTINDLETYRQTVCY